MNLGVGIPTMVSNYLEGRDVILHAENGVLGYGRMVSDENEIDPDIYNAAGQFVALNPGASFFDSVTSFEMARGGRIDTVILGAYEVDQHGSVANWSTADAKRGGIGGAMDLLSGKGDLIIVMEHVDSKGRPKLRRECTYPADRQGVRQLRGDRPGAAALGRQPLRPRRSGAGVHAPGSDRPDGDGRRRRVERSDDAGRVSHSRRGQSTMRFGLLYEAQRPFQGTSVDWNALYKETIEQCVLADRIGFDNLWFVEHHFLTGFSGSPCPRSCSAR